MIVTESELRDQLRRPVPGAVVTVPLGARLSPSAADFVKQWQLVVEERLSSTESAAPARPAAADSGAPRPAWDRSATFPVDTEGQPPRCAQCGSTVADKPTWLTQLNRQHFVAKTHPRIVLRGRLDTLGGAVLEAAAQAHVAGYDRASTDLATLAAYCRELLSAEYNERPAADLTVAGRDAAAVRQVTHDPQGTLGVGHVLLTERSPLIQHRVNRCRTLSREVEVVALEAFPSPHHPYGASICLGLNRLSSACYFVQLRLAQDGVL